MTRASSPLRVVDPDEPAILPYKRGETGAEIAERLRKGIRRRPMVELLP